MHLPELEPLDDNPVLLRLPLPSLRPAALLAGALLILVGALLWEWPAPIMATDLDQHRLNVALPQPAARGSITQTFRPRHDGLNEVEILLARLSTETNGEGELTLRLLDETGSTIAHQSWRATNLAHNRPLILHFPRQPHSAGRLYTLSLEGSGGNQFSAWGYDLDVYEDGRLHLDSAEAIAQELRFQTRYRLGWGAALAQLGQMAWRDGRIVALSLALILLPGCLLLLLARRRLPALDRGAWWALALASGLAIWPLLWFWPTLAGWRWTQGRLALLLGGGWLLIIYLYVSSRSGRVQRSVTGGARDVGRRASKDHLLLLFLLALALAVRLLAVRDLAFPAWVDSSRHALITAVMETAGQAPGDYLPFLDVERFVYHFGFHTLPANLALLVDWPLPRTLLILGQLLNALVVLAVYGGAWLLTRRRRASLLAAFLVGLPFFFPAYYVTWGRFTQLAGVLVLAPLLALTWLLLRGARGWRRIWWLSGLLAAGLFFIHVRVFLIYVPFATLAWLVARARGTRHWLAATAVGLVLVAPRLWQLAGLAEDSGFLAAADESYVQFPISYVTVGWERWFLAVGGLAFLGMAVAALRGRRRAMAALALAGWAGLVTLLLSGQLPALPTIWLVNLNSAYILFFVPLALLLAIAFDHLWRRVRRSSAVVQVFATTVLGAGLAALLLYGVRQQVSIVNPTTVLAWPADAAGIAWAGEHLPSEARVAVNSWRWLGQTWAAGDGGGWLLPLVRLSTTTPPVDYINDPALFRRVIDFNEAAMAVPDWSTPDAAAFLRDESVTHVFAGARGGFFDPSALAHNPQIQMLYAHNGVFIFRVEDPS